MVLDPPWRYRDRLTMSDVKRGAEANYQGTMSFEDIRALPCRSLADDDAIMGLWVGNPIMAWGFELLAAWGFEFKQPWHWVKTSKAYKGKLEELDEDGLAFGMGRLSRTCSETMLIGVRGKINNHLKSRRERNVIPHKALPHSRKPEVFQDRFDRMFPEGERLELFARRTRPNWTCLGNEAPDTKGEDVFVSCNRLLGVSVGSQESMFAQDKPEASP
jgi:N6-adenosine-specific RNA methylase IME4